MKVWKTFAYVSNGAVANVASFLYSGYTEANQCAKVFCNDQSAIAVDVTYIPVQIGDTYSNGAFYRNGTEITSSPTEEETISEHDTEIDDLWCAVLN